MNNYKMGSNFMIIVIGIASFILIVSLTYIGIILSRTSLTEFPPVANTCPDGWGIDASGNCIIPPSTSSNLGSFNPSDTNSIPASSLNDSKTTFNPNDNGWARNGSSICGKKTWANSYNIHWDGISNYNSCN
jgi:hypothetical protein